MKLILQAPFDEKTIRNLRVGSRVSVSGTIYTGRDRLHKHLAQGGESPVNLQDSGIYHCGPVVLRGDDGNWTIRSAGPTTSIREEPYMAEIIRSHGVRVVIGKGGMGEATRAACREYGCVYLQAVGGAAAVIAQQISRVLNVWFLDEFGPTEAMWQIESRGFAAVVGIDATGASLYSEVADSSKKRLVELLAT